jgi:hypothetical protein
VAEGKLNHLADLSHLLSAATNVIVANFVQVVLLLISLDGLALAMDDGILCNNAILGRIYFDDLELYLPHATTDNKEISLTNRTVGLSEVGSEEDIEQGAGNTLNGVGDGKDGNSLGLRTVRSWEERPRSRNTHVFDIRARVDGDHVTVLDAQIVADDSVDSSATVVQLLIGEDDEHCILALLASDQDCVAAKKLERVHRRLGQGNDAVVIIDGIGDPSWMLDAFKMQGRRYRGI